VSRAGAGKRHPDLGIGGERQKSQKPGNKPSHRKTRQFSVIAPGVMLAEVLLQTLKLTLFALGYEMIVSIPAVAGMYPVTAVGSPLNEASTTSVVAVLVAAVVTAVAQAADAMALVPSADVPLAIVAVIPPAAERLAASAVTTPVPVGVAAIACRPEPTNTEPLVNAAAEVVQVAQARVPVAVMVPPVIGAVVATLVTPPPPADELIVWFGQVPVIVTFVPCTSAGVAVPVPPLATGRRPVTPVVSGNPVRLVATPLAGVPSAGVSKVLLDRV
jgi:hypothetical protein